MLLLAKIFEGIGNIDMCKKLLEQINENFSGTIFATESKKMADKL
jgi:hypothetical protein